MTLVGLRHRNSCARSSADQDPQLARVRLGPAQRLLPGEAHAGNGSTTVSYPSRRWPQLDPLRARNCRHAGTRSLTALHAALTQDQRRQFDRRNIQPLRDGRVAAMERELARPFHGSPERSVCLEFQHQSISPHGVGCRANPSRWRAIEFHRIGNVALSRDFEGNSGFGLPADDRHAACGAPWIVLPPCQLRGERFVRMCLDLVQRKRLAGAIDGKSPPTAERIGELLRLGDGLGTGKRRQGKQWAKEDGFQAGAPDGPIKVMVP